MAIDDGGPMFAQPDACQAGALVGGMTVRQRLASEAYAARLQADVLMVVAGSFATIVKTRDPTASEALRFLAERAARNGSAEDRARLAYMDADAQIAQGKK